MGIASWGPRIKRNSISLVSACSDGGWAAMLNTIHPSLVDDVFHPEIESESDTKGWTAVSRRVLFAVLEVVLVTLDLQHHCESSY